MEKLNRLKYWIMLTTAVFVVLMAHIMRSTINLNDTNNFYYYSIAVLFSLSSSLISEKIANKFIKYTWVRKLILGSKYVEGYWFLKTYPVKEDPGSPLLNNGILYMSGRKRKSARCPSLRAI